MVVVASEPERIPHADEGAAPVWITRLRAEMVPPTLASEAFDVKLKMDPEVESSGGTGQPLDRSPAAARERLRASRTAGRGRRAQASGCDEELLGIAVSTGTAAFNYACEWTLFQWGFNYNFDTDATINDRIDLVEDIIYFKDT